MLIARPTGYLILSIFFHALIFCLLIFGFDFATPLSVVENSDKPALINAVVLGDTPKSNILPQVVADDAQPPEKKEVAMPRVVVQKLNTPKDSIVLKPDQPKKQTNQEQDALAKALLADVNKMNKIKKKQIESHFVKALHKEAEKSLRDQLLNENIRLQTTLNQKAQGVVNKYKALILQVISEHWVIPNPVNKKRYSELLIRLAPGGVVLSVQITKSSGDIALDGSARAAVMKASPLPVPQDPAQFEPFRQFVLKVRPENILVNDSR